MGLILPVFLLSAAVLASELLLGRLLAVGLWHHVTYLVVTFALLAFGFAGTVLAVFPRLAGRDARSRTRAFSLYATLAGVSTLATGWAIASANVDTLDLLGDLSKLGGLLGIYLICALPLFFAGLAIVISFRSQGTNIARLYFSNLVGSAAGCGAFVLLIEPLTGPGLLATCAAAMACAGLLPTLRSGGLMRVVAALALIGCTVFAVKPDLIPKIQPVASKKLALALKAGGVMQTSQWNPLCRIDVVKPKDAETPLDVFQDGDAPTWIFREDDASGTSREEIHTPYYLHPDIKSLLVIGTGGGRELSLAVKKGVPRIVGVEINATTTRLLHEDYFKFTGGLVKKPGVEFVNTDGRAYLTRTDELFDIIQMTGVDTYAALNSGSYVLSESYLYTQEAFDAYLDHLKPDGLLSMYRFYFTPPRETLRLFVMAVEALKRRGVSDPSKNVMVVQVGTWAALIASPSPLKEDKVKEIRTLITTLSSHNPSPMGIGLRYDPFQRLDTAFQNYIDAVLNKTERKFFDGYQYVVEPVHDDSPFFYHYHRWKTVFEALSGEGDSWRANTGGLPTGMLVLLGLLASTSVIAFLLILVPLLFFRFRALKMPGGARAGLYFSCLGLGFMFVEIGLAQRFALFLGHPTYSLAVVLGGMLAFSGLGSLTSGLMKPSTAMKVAFPAVLLLVAAMIFALPTIIETWLGAELSTRVFVALATLAPVAFFMGMPMPSGLRILDDAGPDLVPWAWGANGVMSVVGSVLIIILAMTIGFTGVLITSAGLYLLAFLSRAR